MNATRHISISINRPWRDVYEFVSNGQNLPAWASGLGDSVTKEGDDWVVTGPIGKVRIRFAERNKFGILDHDVFVGSDARFYNPMRVFANGTGAEVVFTLFHTSDMTEEKFIADAEWVAKDLKKLREILES